MFEIINFIEFETFQLEAFCCFECCKVSCCTSVKMCMFVYFCAGKQLRKVEHKDEVKKQEYGTDVASILKRRIVMEVSDSSDDSGTDSDDSGWSD